jgi:phosphoglycolate phosphatase-like HAD superfamily hydrolase
MNYDAIVFDLDGVLVQGSATDRAVYEQAARDTVTAFDLDDEAGSDGGADSDGDLATLLADPPSLAAVRETLGSLDVDPVEVWRYREERACELENEQIRGAAREPYPDVDALDELARETPMGVVSNNRMGTVEFVCEHFGFDALLETWYGRHPTFEGHQRMKPDPHYIHRALEDLGAGVEGADAANASADGNHALYVGDRQSDVVAARQAGVDAAFLRREHNRDVTVEPTPDHVLDGLDDLLATA